MIKKSLILLGVVMLNFISAQAENSHSVSIPVTLNYEDGTYTDTITVSWKTGTKVDGSEIIYEEGDFGDGVLLVQKMLNKLGFFDGPATSYYGNATAAAVKAFQKEYNLTATGSIDQSTYNQLKNRSESIDSLPVPIGGYAEIGSDSQDTVYLTRLYAIPDVRSDVVYEITGIAPVRVVESSNINGDNWYRLLLDTGTKVIDGYSNAVRFSPSMPIERYIELGGKLNPKDQKVKGFIKITSKDGYYYDYPDGSTSDGRLSFAPNREIYEYIDEKNGYYLTTFGYWIKGTDASKVTEEEATSFFGTSNKVLARYLESNEYVTEVQNLLSTDEWPFYMSGDEIKSFKELASHWTLGQLDNYTKSALVRYQRKTGLIISGILDMNTLRSLRGEPVKPDGRTNNVEEEITGLIHLIEPTIIYERPGFNSAKLKSISGYYLVRAKNNGWIRLSSGGYLFLNSYFNTIDPNMTYKLGDKIADKEGIRWISHSLEALGYISSIDSIIINNSTIFNDPLEASVKKYQTDLGLTPDGIVTPVIIQQLIQSIDKLYQ